MRTEEDLLRAFAQLEPSSVDTDGVLGRVTAGTVRRRRRRSASLALAAAAAVAATAVPLALAQHHRAPDGSTAPAAHAPTGTRTPAAPTSTTPAPAGRRKPQPPPRCDLTSVPCELAVQQESVRVFDRLKRTFGADIAQSETAPAWSKAGYPVFGGQLVFHDRQGVGQLTLGWQYLDPGNDPWHRHCQSPQPPQGYHCASQVLQDGTLIWRVTQDGHPALVDLYAVRPDGLTVYVGMHEFNEFYPNIPNYQPDPGPRRSSPPITRQQEIALITSPLIRG